MSRPESLDQRADRGAIQTNDQITLPMSGHGAILRLYRATGDHHILADVCPCLGLCPASRYAQRPPCAQAVHQLALESTTTLNVEGLVDGFVRDTHGFVIWEVDT